MHGPTRVRTRQTYQAAPAKVPSDMWKARELACVRKLHGIGAKSECSKYLSLRQLLLLIRTQAVVASAFGMACSAVQHLSTIDQSGYGRHETRQSLNLASADRLKTISHISKTEKKYGACGRLARSRCFPPGLTHCCRAKCRGAYHPQEVLMFTLASALMSTCATWQLLTSAARWRGATPLCRGHQRCATTKAGGSGEAGACRGY